MATKVKCECGLYLNEDNMNKHLTSKTHKDLIDRKCRKLNNYNAMKEPDAISLIRRRWESSIQ